MNSAYHHAYPTDILVALEYFKSSLLGVLYMICNISDGLDEIKDISPIITIYCAFREITYLNIKCIKNNILVRNIPYMTPLKLYLYM